MVRERVVGCIGHAHNLEYCCMIEFIKAKIPLTVSFDPSSIRYNMEFMWIFKILIDAHTQLLAEKTALISLISLLCGRLAAAAEVMRIS